ncbi:hypothetical protein Bca4012_090129 [Brassica carinata]
MVFDSYGDRLMSISDSHTCERRRTKEKVYIERNNLHIHPSFHVLSSLLRIETAYRPGLAVEMMKVMFQPRR